jgi:hypothetical protein
VQTSEEKIISTRFISEKALEGVVLLAMTLVDIRREDPDEGAFASNGQLGEPLNPKERSETLWLLSQTSSLLKVDLITVPVFSDFPKPKLVTLPQSYTFKALYAGLIDIVAREYQCIANCSVSFKKAVPQCIFLCKVIEHFWACIAAIQGHHADTNLQAKELLMVFANKGFSVPSVVSS